jgi:hypothetical protein
MHQLHEMATNADSAVHRSGIVLKNPDRPCFAPLAACTAAIAAADENWPRHDLFTYDDSEFDVLEVPEAEYFDTHAYAAMEFAGCLWNSESSPELRREFWLRWLHELLPCVLGPIKSVIAMID